MTQTEIRRVAESFGSRYGRAPGAARFILTEAKVADIHLLKDSRTIDQLGAMFGVAARTVCDVLRGKTWIGGVKGRGGFKKGDPRNPSLRRVTGGLVVRRPKLALAPIALAYPYIAKPRDDHADLMFVNSLVPRSMPDNVRADICQEMILALLEGRATRESLSANRGADFRRAFYRNNFEQAGFARSFDDVAFAFAESKREAA